VKRVCERKGRVRVEREKEKKRKKRVRKRGEKRVWEKKG
jgi:hypothetical protein